MRCGRPSGRSRIGTTAVISFDRSNIDCCGRPSGRSRIGTGSATDSEALEGRLRSPFGAIEDWNAPNHGSTRNSGVAVALRGDRGLEHSQVGTPQPRYRGCGRPSGRSRIGTGMSMVVITPCRCCGRPSGRSRIGTGQGSAPRCLPPSCGRPSGRSRIGTYGNRRANHILSSLRSPFGAIEDWNMVFSMQYLPRFELRSPFGAIEDWNRAWWIGSPRYQVAVALRGDRGLEPQPPATRQQPT